jgi:peroxiredoxin
MLRYSLILISYILLQQPAMSYQITGNIKDLKASKCFLGHYFGSASQVIYVDTAKVDAKGNFIFEGNQQLLEGLYFVEFPTKKRLDLVIGAMQTFEFSSDLLHLTSNISFKNSEENTFYYNYLNFVRPRQSSLKTRLTSEQSTKIQQELYTFQTNFFKEKNGYLSTSILAAGETPYIPTFTLSNGKPDNDKVYHYYKNHLFDNINLADERLIRTNLIEIKIDEYIQKLTYQVADSAIKSVDALMQKTPVAAFRKYFASKMLNFYQKKTFIGAENVYVHLIDRYYTNEPQLWDTSALKQMTARANTLRPLLLGKKIPNMTVTGADGKTYSLHDIQARYTILYIYSLDCPHCQEHAPKIAALQSKLAAKGIKFFAIAVERDEAKWRGFIAKYRTQNLLNLIDKSGDINFVKDFNTIEYPTDFVLDNQKKIVGKQINPALLEDYIKYLDQTRVAKN